MCVCVSGGPLKPQSFSPAPVPASAAASAASESSSGTTRCTRDSAEGASRAPAGGAGGTQHGAARTGWHHALETVRGRECRRVLFEGLTQGGVSLPLCAQPHHRHPSSGWTSSSALPAGAETRLPHSAPSSPLTSRGAWGATAATTAARCCACSGGGSACRGGLNGAGELRHVSGLLQPGWPGPFICVCPAAVHPRWPHAAPPPCGWLGLASTAVAAEPGVARRVNHTAAIDPLPFLM